MEKIDELIMKIILKFFLEAQTRAFLCPQNCPQPFKGCHCDVTFQDFRSMIFQTVPCCVLGLLVCDKSCSWCVRSLIFLSPADPLLKPSLQLHNIVNPKGPSGTSNTIHH